ncbi:hypothetical protein M1O19_06660 [Dehalococcoidia bacterium]|nr:hypothetical protein [Dehalococcoidia bacterium]
MSPVKSYLDGLSDLLRGAPADHLDVSDFLFDDGRAEMLPECIGFHGKPFEGLEYGVMQIAGNPVALCYCGTSFERRTL